MISREAIAAAVGLLAALPCPMCRGDVLRCQCDVFDHAAPLWVEREPQLSVCALCGFSRPRCFCELPGGSCDPYEGDDDPTSPDCPGCEVSPRDCPDCRRCASCCSCLKEE